MINPSKAFSRGREVLICLLLVLTILAVYFPVRNYDFVNIDDWAYVTANPDIQRGISWDNLKWAFTTRYAANWHPLTNLSHMLDCQLFGLKSGAHHLTNLFFHTLNTLLLFALLKRMTGAIWKSVIVAALFALHPLHVESVAWISERKDVLSGFFFLLTLWFYVDYQFETANPKRSIQNYCFALLSFALGLLSKPMLVTLPFVLLLLDFWPLNRLKISSFEDQNSKFIVLEKLPFFALAAASSAVTFFVQKGGGAVVALESYPLIPRIANALVSFVRYLAKTFFPKSLAVFYPYGVAATWQVAGALLLLVGILFASIWFARRRQYLFVGCFWFFGMLVPVIGLVQVGSQSMADRYTYLPHIGLFVALVWLVADWIKDETRRLAQIAVGLLLLGCAVVSSLQVRHWRNTETLLRHAVAVTSGNAPAHYYLAFALEAQGKINEAIAQYLQAIRIFPGHVDAHCNLANILSRQNQREEALSEYAKALQINPNSAPTHFGLAELLVKQGKLDEAKKHYEAAYGAKPDFAEAHYQLAVLLINQKEIAQAIQHLKESIRIKSDWIEPLNNLAWLLATNPDEKLRDGNLAVELAERAARISKNINSGVLDTLGAAYAEAAQFDQAIIWAEAAMGIAARSGQNEMEKEIDSRVKLYQSRQAFRDENLKTALSVPYK